jgi:hypothetical protein
MRGKKDHWEQAKQNALYVMAKFNVFCCKDVRKIIAEYILHNPVHKGDKNKEYVLQYSKLFDALYWDWDCDEINIKLPACTICYRPCYPTFTSYYYCSVHEKYMGICVCCRKRRIKDLNTSGVCKECEQKVKDYDIHMEWRNWNHNAYALGLVTNAKESHLNASGFDLFDKKIPEWLQSVLGK